MVVGNLGAQKAKRNDTPISAKKDIMGDKTVRVRADLHHIIKIETAKNGGNVKEVMDKALEEYGRWTSPPDDVTCKGDSEKIISLLGKLIYPNLENGIVIPSDKEKMIALANKYIEKENVDALILACTELPLAIKPEDVNVPIVNTTQVHINAIYQYAIR